MPTSNPRPEPKQIADKLIELHGRLSETHKFLMLSVEEMRQISGRKLLRGKVLESLEGNLLRRPKDKFYLFRSNQIFLLMPFGMLSSLPEMRMPDDAAPKKSTKAVKAVKAVKATKKARP